MKDHLPSCETRIFVGSQNCTCGAADEGTYGTTTNAITDVEGRDLNAPTEPVVAAPAVEPTITVKDSVVTITVAKTPQLVIVNGVLFSPMETKK